MESERFVPFVLYTERIAKNIKRLADKKNGTVWHKKRTYYVYSSAC